MPAKPIQVFDKAYYDRYYRDPRTRASSPQEATRRAAFLCAYLLYLEIPVHRVLDIGCGLGQVLKSIQRRFPDAHCVGVEVSDYLCERYGWPKASVTSYRAKVPFDLVICNDVIQYLDDAEAEKAITNLARLCRDMLYLGVLTKEDWDQHCDRDRTDGKAYLRKAGWYRTRLDRWFINVGGGVFLRKSSGTVLWELEWLGS